MQTLDLWRMTTVSSILREAICKVLLILAASVTATGALHAQAKPAAEPIDLAFTFMSERSLRANTGQDFWMEGGSAELGVAISHGVGVALDFTGTHTSSIGSSGVPLVLETVTVGPRYRLHAERHWSPYVQVLVGSATGMNSTFATPSGAVSNINSFAIQPGGGLDYRYSRHVGIRVIDVGYLHTGLSNGGSNAQDIFRLGAGIVFRLGS
jgi:hypothetical protein